MCVRSPPPAPTNKYQWGKENWLAPSDNSVIATILERPRDCFHCCYFHDGMLRDPLSLHEYFLYKSGSLSISEGKHQSISPTIQTAPFGNPAFLYVKHVGTHDLLLKCKHLREGHNWGCKEQVLRCRETSESKAGPSLPRASYWLCASRQITWSLSWATSCVLWD